jgi:hypothetical protein
LTTVEPYTGTTTGIIGVQNRREPAGTSDHSVVSSATRMADFEASMNKF